MSVGAVYNEAEEDAEGNGRTSNAASIGVRESRDLPTNKENSSLFAANVQKKYIKQKEFSVN